MDFNSLVNQNHVRQILTRTADRDQLPNSYLFCGPEGVGKWVAALALTAYLNCADKKDGDSCGACPACRQIQKLQYPNLHIAIPTPPSKSDKEELENYWEILKQKIAEPYSLITGRRQMSIPVATVREMRRNLAQKAPLAGKRVVIIEQMDRMMMTSADALLKLVEEPPAKTLIIITTSHAEKLLPTIVSRCRQVRFAHLPEEKIAGHLAEYAGLSETKATLLARLARGSLGQALYLAAGDHEQDREVAKLIFKGMFHARAIDLIAEAADILPYNDRFRLNCIIGFWQTLFRDIIVLKNGEQSRLLVNVDFIGELEKIAAREIRQESLLDLPAFLGSVIDDINLNVDTYSAVGGLIIDIRRRLGLDSQNH